ncbi:MAG TPA: 30S ribosome-binding factor RbfA [Intrasporangiaceae bacterium]|nr:30S ribosome-binding factor RbfA [Intrasporangiaceae bacterium]
MADAARARKIADRIKQVVAANLGSLIKDPDLGFVTFTDVKVTNDLQHAQLYYTVFGDEDQHAKTAELLARHKGRIRSFVGKQIGIRLTPTVEFFADAIPESAAAIEDLLREAKERDAATAAAASNATYAGDQDPYKKDRAESDVDSDDDPAERRDESVTSR